MVPWRGAPLPDPARQARRPAEWRFGNGMRYLPNNRLQPEANSLPRSTTLLF